MIYSKIEKMNEHWILEGEIYEDGTGAFLVERPDGTLLNTEPYSNYREAVKAAVAGFSHKTCDGCGQNLPVTALTRVESSWLCPNCLDRVLLDGLKWIALEKDQVPYSIQYGPLCEAVYNINR
ncbi:MAG: hypothetical protein M0036_19110 [Desulfobacteraceae bacterium]|nr:hypothetical protein [Desulfobacteraceae bacterium]